MLDILILMTLSCFILYKLYSILGREDDSDVIHSPRNVEQPMSRASQVIEDVEYLRLNTQPELEFMVNQIKADFPNFNLTTFAKGAEKAFEVIVRAYTKGDREPLKFLLSEQVYQQFEVVIIDREKIEQTHETIIVSFKASDIINIKRDASIVDITVQFTTEQINLTKDTSGKVIAGNPSQIDTVSDIWTFRKDLSISDPAWRLISTNN